MGKGLGTWLMMGSVISFHWSDLSSNLAGSRKVLICLCFNSEELLGIQPGFSLMTVAEFSALRFEPVQHLAWMLFAVLLKALQSFQKL